MLFPVMRESHASSFQFPEEKFFCAFRIIDLIAVGDENGVNPVQGVCKLHALFQAESEAGRGEGVAVAEFSEMIAVEMRPLS